MKRQEPFTWLQPALESFLVSGDTQLVCEFTGASTTTVRRWVTNKNPAKGSNEIRLWHFLLAAGYEFPELRIDEWSFYLAQLLAYSVITAETATELCGVKNSQDTLLIMRGRLPMHPAATLAEMQEMYDEQLRVAMSRLQESLSVVGGLSLPPLPSASAEVEAHAPAFDVLVPVLAAMIKGMMPYAQLALKSWTPAQRARLRELVGDELFELANNTHNLAQILGALNSERSRAQHLEGK